jgi:DNA-binding transcriptional MerR regulator
MIGQTQTMAVGANLSIRDVAKICEVPAHTIRFWEKEFKEYLDPPRTPGRQRRYSDNEIGQIFQIKQLLWNEKFSIEGARRMLHGAAMPADLAGTNNAQSVNPHELAIQIAKVIQNYTVHDRSAVTAGGNHN